MYSGIVYRLHNEEGDDFKIKPIKKIIDDHPIVNAIQISFWEWIAIYYACNLGDVMQAALPNLLKLSSETIIVWNDTLDQTPNSLSDEAFMVSEALCIKKKLTLNEIKDIINKASISKVLDELLINRIGIVSDILEEKYKPKFVKFIKLKDSYATEEQLTDLFNDLSKAPKQLAILFAYLELEHKKGWVASQELQNKANATSSQLKHLVNKGIMEFTEQKVGRLDNKFEPSLAALQLSNEQEHSFSEIKRAWQEKEVVLLHGVTGSGKTSIYIQLIKEAIAAGKQVLMLMPEIALTTHIVGRLSQYFGNEMGVYHSKFSDNERVEIWNKVADQTYKFVVGARSSVWLPFQNLAYIIVDEEHDTSYKQFDPAPRFHARDAAIYLALLHNSKVLLGSATPSLETYHNAINHKYGLVELNNRFGDIAMPKVEIVDARKYLPALSNLLTEKLLEKIKSVLALQKQVILFQNKRGYAPFLICASCGWVPQCKNCEVSLTYHKYNDKLHCHYCGAQYPIIQICEQCGLRKIINKSFGTEKIEEELNRIFPSARIARLDLDAAKNKNAHNQILLGVESGDIDILIGTQMVVKGLDFDNVVLVGVLSADSLWSFPDFRIHEKAFQLLSQVSGRPGRKEDNGLVMIQTYKTSHPLLQMVKDHDYKRFYQEEIAIRKEQQYPPFVRMIKVSVKHTNRNKAEQAINQLHNKMVMLENIVINGPSPGLIARVRNKYVFDFWIKHSKNYNSSMDLKERLIQSIDEIAKKKGNSAIQFIVDVDVI